MNLQWMLDNSLAVPSHPLSRSAGHFSRKKIKNYRRTPAIGSTSSGKLNSMGVEMKHILSLSALIAFVLILSGCGTPSFELRSSGTGTAPSAPKVTDLINNLQCELYYATTEPSIGDNSLSKVPKYDRPSVSPSHLPIGDGTVSQAAYFKDVAYVATATLTLQVTNTDGFNPSLSKILPDKAPMTNLTLAVSGQYSEIYDRNLTFNTSIDFTRFDSENPPTECGGEHGELGGDLKLGEIISMGLLAAATNTHGVLETLDAASPAYTGIKTYQYGVFGTVTDFSITEGINGGPNWTLVHFKGPSGGGGGGGSGGGSGASGGSGGGGSQSLLSFNRIVKDTLNISFIPACLRVPKDDAEAAHLPAWTKTLDLCPGVGGEQRALVGGGPSAKVTALAIGSSNNLIQLLQQITPQLLQ